MISNSSCSELKLVDNLLLPGYQQKFQFTTSTTVNNNNNNDISNNKTMSSAPTTLQLQSTKPFTFYTSGGTPTTECTTIIIQRSSNEEIVKNSNAQINKPSTDQSIQCAKYEPCSYLNSKQENELTKKIFNNFRNDSALNGVVGVSSGEVVTLTRTTEKTTGDSSSNSSNSNSSNGSKSSKSDRQKSPMCRTEDQENAFRQIEDVHNYSKLNRYGYCNGRSSQAANVAMYSSNSSNQDDDEEDEDEEDEAEEEEDDDEDDDIDYERHVHAKVRKLSAIGQRNEKQVKPVVASRSPKEIQDRQEIYMQNSSVGENTEVKVEGDGNKVPPDHHARRPMNAFLIFCKRHRGIVKEKYKNLENRSITKILGEWWASLDPIEKKCYENLAKQNKDAFFSANPNFKWYKLPAPSLRTLNTRPSNVERPGSGEYQCELNDLLTPSYHTITHSTGYGRNEPKKVAYFKLADETQMGELSNLIRPSATHSTNDALQDALGETSDYFKAGCKRKSSLTVEDPLSIKRLHSDNSFSSSEDDLTPKKSSRSCKGKKYQEFINSGQIAAVTPKKQLSMKPSRATIGSCNNSQQFLMHNGHCNKVSPTIRDEPLSPKKEVQSRAGEGQYLLPDFSDTCRSPSKQQFSFVSFDLEDKIRALPAQCLETYLQRKKSTKRKKKINSKKRTPPQPKAEAVTLKGTSQLHQHPPKTAQEAKEQMVGSQKRKARKESITRRDINSIQNDVQVLLSSVPVIVGGGVNAVPQSLIAVNQNATSDLLILAEVAANHTGIAQ